MDGSVLICAVDNGWRERCVVGTEGKKKAKKKKIGKEETFKYRHGNRSNSRSKASSHAALIGCEHVSTQSHAAP